MVSVGINAVAMNLLLLLLVVISLSICDSIESVRSDSLNEGKLILDIAKRSSSSDFRSRSRSISSDGPDHYTETAAASARNVGTNSIVTVEDGRQQTCESVTEEGRIIKATDSIGAGAVFIDSIKGVSSNSECARLCCKNSTCDVSIYQDKADRYCYLFKCDKKCIFKQHGGYFVTTLSRPVWTEQPEEDLEHLVGDGLRSNSDQAQAPHSGRDRTARPTPTTTSTTTTTTSTTTTTRLASAPEDEEPVIAPHTAGLTAYCNNANSCEDPNAACIGHTCQCSKGYYNKDGLCRQVCQPPNFECLDLGTLSRGPECIPSKHVCDSYMQCADGSDEFNCETADFSPGSSVPKSDSVSKSHEGSEPQPDSSYHGDFSPGSSVPKSDSVSKSHEGEESPASVAPTSSTSTTDKAVPTTSTPSGHHDSNERVFMSREKVIIASSTSNAQGPIIALSLGLAFTLILLVLVGCRLRNMRARLRKGRPLHSNEADYLINGMYL